MNLQQKKDNSFLATEPLGKLLLKLSLPTVTAQIINMLYNIVDRIYIGHIPETGALALTGVGICMPLIMIVSAFAALVGNGGAPRASIFMGKGDKESAERTLGNCFTTQIFVSFLLTLILFTGNRSFLMAFGASENTIPYAVFPSYNASHPLAMMPFLIPFLPYLLTFITRCCLFYSRNLFLAIPGILRYCNNHSILYIPVLVLFSLKSCLF